MWARCSVDLCNNTLHEVDVFSPTTHGAVTDGPTRAAVPTRKKEGIFIHQGCHLSPYSTGNGVRVGYPTRMKSTHKK